MWPLLWLMRGHLASFCESTGELKRLINGHWLANGQCHWLGVESVLSVWPVWDCMNLNIMHCSIWADTGEKPKKRNQCECSGSCFQRKLFIRAKSKDCLLISGRDQQRGKTWVPKGTFLSAQTSKQIKAKSKSLSTKPLLPFAVRDALKILFFRNSS